MSYYDNWLLEGSEPDAWDEESAPYGLCDGCESPLGELGDCPGCNPVLVEETIPVVASFEVAEGKVREL